MYKLLFLLILIPATCLADISLDYSRSSDYSDGQEISSDYLRIKASGEPRKDVDWRLYRTYKRTAGITLQDNAGAGIGWDPKINERWSAWVDAEIRQDPAIEVDKEIFLGAGPKVYFYKRGPRKVSLSVGLLHHSRKPGNYEEQRWSIRPKFSTENWKAVAFYQPNVRDSSDYINMIEVEGRINKYFFVFWEMKKRSADNSRNEQGGIRLKYKTEFLGG